MNAIGWPSKKFEIRLVFTYSSIDDFGILPPVFRVSILIGSHTFKMMIDHRRLGLYFGHSRRPSYSIRMRGFMLRPNALGEAKS